MGGSLSGQVRAAWVGRIFNRPTHATQHYA
jgi:hypothetical protein